MNEHKLLIKTRVIALTGEWTGWQFTARLNPPLGVLFDITSGDLERIVNGMAKIIISWNFVDENGQPLPAPSAEVMATYVTPDLMGAVSSAWVEEMTKVPPA